MCLYFSCGICTHYTSRPSSARFLLRNLMWESLILIVRGQQYENCGTLVRRTVSLIQRQQKKTIYHAKQIKQIKIAYVQKIYLGVPENGTHDVL